MDRGWTSEVEVEGTHRHETMMSYCDQQKLSPPPALAGPFHRNASWKRRWPHRWLLPPSFPPSPPRPLTAGRWELDLYTLPITLLMRACAPTTTKAATDPETLPSDHVCALRWIRFIHGIYQRMRKFADGPGSPRWDAASTVRIGRCDAVNNVILSLRLHIVHRVCPAPRVVTGRPHSIVARSRLHTVTNTNRDDIWAHPVSRDDPRGHNSWSPPTPSTAGGVTRCWVRKRLRACLGASDQQQHTSPIGVLHRTVANRESQRRIPRLNKLPRMQHSVRLHSNDGAGRREPPEALRTGYDAGHYHASLRLDKPVKVRFDADASQSAELEPETPFERESLKGLASWQRAGERPTGSVPPVHRSGS
ncbi:hypothetical protein CMUS01_06506 [Colletotrichum musicola]|uniref:Uncharacterized protein n=1 Tax=Colletotrichum musicola TaxID=2175873 RepID=A0A8H6KLB7_9PEZI|nr:hypothetical protein CMUS01_06506 [Colletotrichum musicola]